MTVQDGWRGRFPEDFEVGDVSAGAASLFPRAARPLSLQDEEVSA
jgi:hypothetical protein